MDDANIGYQEKRDIWTDYNHRQEFEHQLIDRKTTWWLTSQTILIAAYGLSLQERADSYRQVVAGAGLAIATVSLIGLLGLILLEAAIVARLQRLLRSGREVAAEAATSSRARMGSADQEHMDYIVTRRRDTGSIHRHVA